MFSAICDITVEPNSNSITCKIISVFFCTFRYVYQVATVIAIVRDYLPYLFKRYMYSLIKEHGYDFGFKKNNIEFNSK